MWRWSTVSVYVLLKNNFNIKQNGETNKHFNYGSMLSWKTYELKKLNIALIVGILVCTAAHRYIKLSSCFYYENVIYISLPVTDLACGTIIDGCDSCAVDSGTTKCDLCSSSKVTASDRLSCIGKCTWLYS